MCSCHLSRGNGWEEFKFSPSSAFKEVRSLLKKRAILYFGWKLHRIYYTTIYALCVFTYPKTVPTEVLRTCVQAKKREWVCELSPNFPSYCNNIVCILSRIENWVSKRVWRRKKIKAIVCPGWIFKATTTVCASFEVTLQVGWHEVPTKSETQNEGLFDGDPGPPGVPGLSRGPRAQDQNICGQPWQACGLLLGHLVHIQKVQRTVHGQ